MSLISDKVKKGRNRWQLCLVARLSGSAAYLAVYSVPVHCASISNHHGFTYVRERVMSLP